MSDIQAALGKWETGRRAARQRFDEACTELDRILATPIRAGLDDPDRWRKTVENSDRRLGELRRGVEDAWAPLEQAFAEAHEAAPDDGARRRLRYQQAEQRARRDQVLQYIHKEGRTLMAARRADAARVLHTAASLEWGRTRPCPRCGAGVEVGAVATPTDFACAGCGHVAAFGPGPATTRYLEALAAIADEQTLEHQVALDEARRTFRGYAHPTEGDFEVLTSAARAWLDAWTGVVQDLHPQLPAADRDAEKERRLKEALREHQSEGAVARRRQMGLAMRHAAAGERAEVLQLASDDPRDPGAFLDDLCTCLHEHGNRDAAWQMLALLHHVRQEQAERNGWMQQRLMSLDDQLRTR